jgi:hypothetical protein
VRNRILFCLRPCSFRNGRTFRPDTVWLDASLRRVLIYLVGTILVGVTRQVAKAYSVLGSATGSVDT